MIMMRVIAKSYKLFNEVVYIIRLIKRTIEKSGDKVLDFVAIFSNIDKILFRS